MVVVTLLFSFVILIAYLVNLMVNRPQLVAEKHLSDKDFTEFTTLNENGHKIQAYFYSGKPNNGVLLLCHGHGVTHGHMDDMVGFLRKAGLGIILFDFRAHGRSEGKLCSIGVKEWNDIAFVIEAAKKKGFIDESTNLAAYGRSMGAASLINGSAKLPDIKAFILESSFENLRKIAARDAWHNVRIPDTIITDFAFWVIDVVTSTDFSKNAPEEKISGIGTRPAFLIHDELDHRANLDAFNALKSRLPTAETFSAAGTRHVKAHSVHEEEFEKRFLGFLTSSGIISQR